MRLPRWQNWRAAAEAGLNAACPLCERLSLPDPKNAVRFKAASNSCRQGFARNEQIAMKRKRRKELLWNWLERG